jgi:hypothetical protein
MNLKEFDNALPSFKKRNPHLFSVVPLRPQVGQQKAQRPLDGQSQGQQARAPGVATNRPHVRVSLVHFRCRAVDSDNWIAGAKPFRDAIAKSLGIDDGLIEWEYAFHLTQGQPGTAVKIDITP